MRCGSGKVKLRRNLMANGVSQVAWFCLECSQWAEKPAHWLKYSDVLDILKPYGANMLSIPLVADYSTNCRCIICGEPGEWHHWAPQSMELSFGADWWKWPGANLCIAHHRLWHRIVTPGLIPEGSNHA